jgi:hypothetical protein
LRQLPVRSWRAKGAEGILACKASAIDPAFDIDGLPNPFSVYFPVFITNLYAVTIYVTALLISPPAGWTDSEQNVVTIGVGLNARAEKSNATRATPTAGTNETITVRFNYRTGSYTGTIVGFDEFTFTIYWESVLAGTIDDTDDFETDFEGWTKTSLVGSVTMGRTTSAVVHGAFSLYLSAPIGAQCYIEKTVTMGAGTRAYLFGFLMKDTGAANSIETISSPVENLEIPYQAVDTWRRWGVRLNPGASNTVRIYFRAHWGSQFIDLDYLRWVRY